MDFLKRFSGNNFALSDVEDNIPKLLNRSPSRSPKGLTAKFLEFDGLFYFIDNKFGSFKNPFAMTYKLVCKLMILQLTCLNFTLDSQDLCCWFKRKNDIFELWQQRKQFKIMEMSEASPDTYDERYIHQFHSEPTQKIPDMLTLPILAGDSRFGSFNFSSTWFLKSCKKFTH